MSDLRATDRTSSLEPLLKTLGLFLVCVVGLLGCPILDPAPAPVPAPVTYTVTYTANGADSG